MKLSGYRHLVPLVLLRDRLWLEYFDGVFSIVDELNSKLLGLVYSDNSQDFYFILGGDYWVLNPLGGDLISDGVGGVGGLSSDDVFIQDQINILQSSIIYSDLFYSFPEYFRVSDGRFRLLGSDSFKLEFEIDFSGDSGYVERVLYIPFKFLVGREYNFELEIIYSSSGDESLLKFYLMYNNLVNFDSTEGYTVLDKILLGGLNEVSGRFNINGLYVKVVKLSGVVGVCRLKLGNITLRKEGVVDNLSRWLYLYDFLELSLEDIRFHFSQLPFRVFDLSRGYLSLFLYNLNNFISKLGSYESVLDYFYYNGIQVKVVELYSLVSSLHDISSYVSGSQYDKVSLFNNIVRPSGFVVHDNLSGVYSDVVFLGLGHNLTVGDSFYLDGGLVSGGVSGVSEYVEVLESGIDYVKLSKFIDYNGVNIIEAVNRVVLDYIFYLDLDFSGVVEVGDYGYFDILLESSVRLGVGDRISFVNVFYRGVGYDEYDLLSYDVLGEDLFLEVVEVKVSSGYIYLLRVKLLLLDLGSGLNYVLLYNFLRGYSDYLERYLGYYVSPGDGYVKVPYVDIYLSSSVVSLDLSNKGYIKEVLYSVLPANIVIREVGILGSGEDVILLDIDDYLDIIYGVSEVIVLDEFLYFVDDSNTYVVLHDFSDIVYGDLLAASVITI